MLFKKTGFKHLRQYLLLVVATASIMTGSLLLSTTAQADPTQSDPVQTECLKVVPQKASTACRGTNNTNITHARNAASYACKDKAVNGGAAATCVVSKAKGYIDEAAKKLSKHSSASDFNNALTDVLKKTGFDYNNPNKNLGGESPSSVVCANGVCSDPAADPNCNGGNCDFIKKYVNPAINLLSISFGVIAVISIVLGAVQYSASGGDPQKVTQAKQRISKTIVAVVAYFFLYAFLQFIVPGGIFH